MYLVLLTSGLCTVKAVLPFIINWILSYLYKESSTEILLRRKEYEITTTLGRLSIVDEFAKYAKLQRQLNKVKQDLTDANSQRLSDFTRLRLTINYAVQLIYAFVILITIWIYKYTPVMVLPTQWISPFGPIMSWPTGAVGGISISVWLLMLESSFRTIISNVDNLMK